MKKVILITMMFLSLLFSAQENDRKTLLETLSEDTQIYINVYGGAIHGRDNFRAGKEINNELNLFGFKVQKDYKKDSYLGFEYNRFNNSFNDKTTTITVYYRKDFYKYKKILLFYKINAGIQKGYGNMFLDEKEEGDKVTPILIPSVGLEYENMNIDVTGGYSKNTNGFMAIILSFKLYGEKPKTKNSGYI